jgi:thioredoxin 1
MAPILENVSKEYKGKVELVKINADESGDLLRKLKVFSIPTMLVYQNGQISGRFVGVVGAKQVQTIFESAFNKLIPLPEKTGNVNRIVSLIGSVGVFLLAAYSGFSPILLTASAIIFFYAIHDRCPIWKAFMGWIK